MAGIGAASAGLTPTKFSLGSTKFRSGWAGFDQNQAEIGLGIKGSKAPGASTTKPDPTTVGSPTTWLNPVVE